MRLQSTFWNTAATALTLAGALAPLGMAHAQGGGMAPPFAGGGMKPPTLAEALKMAPMQDKSLMPLAKAADMAEAKMKKAPKDAGAKKAFVDAEYKLGHAAEYDSAALMPSVKYRASLAAYNKALAADPRHQPSLMEKQKIVDIYKGMPGGVPTK